MSQVDDVEMWLGRIETAKKARYDAEAEWERNRQMIQASTYTDLPKPYARVWVNLMLSIVKTMVPNLYFKAPEFTCLPMRPQDEKTYLVAQEIINYYARTGQLKQQMKKVVLDALVCTYGVLKVGWVMEDVDLNLDVDPESGDREVTDDSEEMPLSSVQRNQIKGGIGLRPFQIRVSPWNFLRNRGSTSLKNASWVAERVFLPLQEVKNDPQYTNKSNLRSNAVPSMTASQTFGEGYILTERGTDQYTMEGRALSDPDEELVEMWEIWDRASEKRIVIARGGHKPLCFKDWPYDLDGRFPYIEVQFNDVPDEPYPISFCSSFREIISQINIISSYELEFVKRSVGHLGVDSNIVDEIEIERIRAGEPVGVVCSKGPPADAFAAVGGVPLNPDLKFVHAKAEANLETISGASDALRGGEAPAGQLATVAKLQATGTSLKVGEMQDIVSDAMIEWAEMVDMLAKQLCDKPTAIRISAEDGFSWKTFTQQDIKGRYEYGIIPGSMLPQNEDQQQQQALNLLNLSAPFIAPGSLQVNGAVLYNEVLRKYKFPNAKKILGIEPPPIPQDPTEENFDMLTGGSPPVSPKENLQQHKQVHMAYMQQYMQQPNADPAVVDRLMTHLQATDQMIQQQQMQQLQQLVQQKQLHDQLTGKAPAGPPGPGQPPPGAPPTGGPPGPAEQQPGPKRGPGNGGPLQPGPARPRLMTNKPPSMGHMLGQQQRSAPGAPGNGIGIH